MIINDLFNNKKCVAEAIGDLGSKRDQGKTIRKWRKQRGLDEQGVIEGLAQDEAEEEYGGWRAELVNQINYNTFEVEVTNARSKESANFIIRPVDMVSYGPTLSVETFDVHDLQTGQTQSWTNDDPAPEGPIAYAISALFYDEKPLQKALQNIVDTHNKKGQDTLPGLDKRRSIGQEVGIDDYVDAGEKTQDAMAKMKKGVAEVSDKTLISYLNKVSDDSLKHDQDPSKRSAEKRNRSVSGFAQAFNKLDSRKPDDSVKENNSESVTHRIGLTVTDPNHPMVSKRGETYQKSVRVTGPNREAAINQAIAHYRRKGYKVHDHHYLGTVDQGVAEGQLELNTPDPVVVVQDQQGKILDKVNLSVAAQKYKLGQPQNIKNQLAHQNYTKIGSYTIVSPMSGQPQDQTTTGQKTTFATPGVVEDMPHGQDINDPLDPDRMDNRNRPTKRNIQARLGHDERGDAKHPGAEVRQLGPRGKVKNVSEVSLGDYRKKAALDKALAQTDRFFGRDDAAKVAAADKTIAKREKGLARADARIKPYTPPQHDAEKYQRDLTAKYPNIDELVAAAEKRRDPQYDYAEGDAYYRGREAEQHYQKLKQIQRVIQGLNESLNRSHLP